MAKKKRTPPLPSSANTGAQHDPHKVHKARQAFRKARGALGLSQQDMAQELGKSVALIQAIEGGGRPVSSDVSGVLQGRYGLIRQTIEGATAEPLTLLGEKVSREAVEKVKNDPQLVLSDNDLAEFTSPLVRLLRAAASVGKLRHFGACYRDVLKDLRDSLRLERALVDSLQPTVRITRGQLRRAPGYRKEWDDLSRPDEEEVPIVVPGASAAAAWFEPSRWIPDCDQLLKAHTQSAAPPPPAKPPQKPK